ncbi:MAG: hypothetical protein ACLUZ6_02375 [Lachnospira eligens]
MNLRQMILRQQELLSLARSEHRELSAQEQTEFDNLTRQIAAAARRTAICRRTARDWNNTTC